MAREYICSWCGENAWRIRKDVEFLYLTCLNCGNEESVYCYSGSGMDV